MKIRREQIKIKWELRIHWTKKMLLDIKHLFKMAPLADSYVKKETKNQNLYDLLLTLRVS